VSINVSGLQIYRSDLAATLAAIQRDTGVPPGMIEIELTESTLMEDVHAACEVLGALKRAGYALAIDDFGTGYSSLAYLKRFPLDKLKIDRSFVTDLCNNPEDRAIARAVIQIARSLKLRVIAEGVETAEQMALLRRQGCHEGQGYLFGRPVPAEEFGVLLAGQAARRGALRLPPRS
jgi:EAL domain-containing protein (putative c-di-GMP-specific phosphodiesterase class I)